MMAEMSKKKVLIVDDDYEMRQSIRRLLVTEFNCQIDEVGDGNEVEDKIKEFAPDLIVLDVKMPGKDGYATCMHIRDSLGMKHIKIVGISGVSGRVGAAFMDVLGANCYFEKPFDNEKFKKKISELLTD